MLRKQMLTKLISIGSYSPEVRAFGILIPSTKVFRLIICKTLGPSFFHILVNSFSVTCLPPFYI